MNDRKNKPLEEERSGRSVLARGALEGLTEDQDLHSPWKRQILQAKKRKGDQKAFLLLNLQIKNLKVKKSWMSLPETAAWARRMAKGLHQGQGCGPAGRNPSMPVALGPMILSLNDWQALCKTESYTNAHLWNLEKWSCSVTKSCPTPCDPRDCSMPGLSVFHYLPEFAQVHVHWVSNGIDELICKAKIEMQT